KDSITAPYAPAHFGEGRSRHTHVNTMVSFSGACLLCLRGYLPGLWATRGQRIYSHYKQKKAVHLQGLVVVHGKCHCWCWEDSDDGNPACARTS
ncbi:hypothetical protein STEG23_029457, partial [Scotinomys teguina]